MVELLPPTPGAHRAQAAHPSRPRRHQANAPLAERLTRVKVGNKVSNLILHPNSMTGGAHLLFLFFSISSFLKMRNYQIALKNTTTFRSLSQTRKATGRHRKEAEKAKAPAANPLMP